VVYYPQNRCLAVPACNEQDSIHGVIQALREHASDFDIIVIDDGSTDDTRRLAEAPGVHAYSLGIGGTAQVGFTFALEQGSRGREAGHLMSRIQIVAVAGAVALVVIVLELVRRQRLMERYALLWLLSAVVILGLAVWKNALERLANAIGIVSAPNARFFVAVAFILLLLLHFSAAMSPLSDQSKVIAQPVRELEGGLQWQLLASREGDESLAHWGR
jgi:hypothetical protein